MSAMLEKAAAEGERLVHAEAAIPLALYRLVAEKFGGIVILQEFEVPREFYGFELLAELGEELVLVDYVYRPDGTFREDDVLDVLKRRDMCSRACGWDVSPRVALFFIGSQKDRMPSHSVLQELSAGREGLELSRLVYQVEPRIALTELSAKDEYVSWYDRSQQRL